MNYNALDSRVIRERVDMAQLWQAWTLADDLRRHSFRGSLEWERRSGKDYLYRRKSGVVKSLGPRSAETEITFAAFHEGRAANRTRLATLAVEIDRQAAVLRALNAGRLPLMAARVLRALRAYGKNATIRVIGTNALYGYESLAGVVFDASATATGDVDLLVDDRNRLRLLSEDGLPVGLTQLVRKEVDKTFQPRNAADFRLTNDRGYMIEFVRPEPRPAQRFMPGATPLRADDVRPAPLDGLQWLVNAPAVDLIVLDERGQPAPMRCPDPRIWAYHKLWLSRRVDRDPQKKRRDLEQARLVLQLLAEQLPQFPLDAGFLALLPSELRPLTP